MANRQWLLTRHSWHIIKSWYQYIYRLGANNKDFSDVSQMDLTSLVLSVAQAKIILCLILVLILHTTQATPNLCPFVISAIWGCNWSSMSQIRTDGMWPLWKQHNKKLQLIQRGTYGPTIWLLIVAKGKRLQKLFFLQSKEIHNILLHSLQGVLRIREVTAPWK